MGCGDSSVEKQIQKDPENKKEIKYEKEASLGGNEKE